MILFKIDAQRSPVAPRECNAPWAVYVNRIAPRSKATQGMELKARLMKRFQIECGVHRFQAKESSALKINSHMGAFTVLKQFSQSAMPKALNHRVGGWHGLGAPAISVETIASPDD